MLEEVTNCYMERRPVNLPHDLHSGCEEVCLVGKGRSMVWDDRYDIVFCLKSCGHGLE